MTNVCAAAAIAAFAGTGVVLAAQASAPAPDPHRRLFALGDFRLDADYERAFIQHVTFHPIPSLWGHRAGGGRSPEDVRFLNAEIGRFLD